MNKYEQKYGEDIWRLIVAARKIVIQFRSPVLQEHMTSIQKDAYREIQKVVWEVAPMIKNTNYKIALPIHRR